MAQSTFPLDSLVSNGPTPTNADSVEFLVTFTVPIQTTSVDTADFRVAPNKSVATGTVDAVTYKSGSGNKAFIVRVINITGDGSLVLNCRRGAVVKGIPPSMLQVATMYTLGSAISSSPSYVIDNTAPTITAITRENPNPTNAVSVTYRVRLSEAIDPMSLIATDFLVRGTGSANGSINPTIIKDATVPGPQDSVYLVTVDNVVGDSTLALEFTGSVTDRAGNASTALYSAGQVYTIDNTVSVPVVNTPASAIGVDATFSTILGTHSEIGVTINLYADLDDDDVADNTTSLGSGVVSGLGLWLISATLTQNAVNNFVVRATDALMNQSTDVSVSSITDGGTPGVQVNGVHADFATAVIASGTVTFSAGNDNIRVVDIGNTNPNTMTVAITTTGGTFSLSQTTGLTGSGNGTGSLTYEGSAVDLNAALDGATYTAPSTVGTQTITITSTDALTSKSASFVPREIAVSVLLDLSPGDLAFVAFNGENNATEKESFAVVTLVDLNGSVANPIEIRFTDEEWNGMNIATTGAFNSSNEGELLWTINTTIAAGTVVNFTNTRDGPTVNAMYGTLADVAGTNFRLNNGGNSEGLFAFTGSSGASPITLLAGLLTNGLTTTTHSMVPNSLVGTGLIQGTHVVDFAGTSGQDALLLEFTGIRTGQPFFSDYLAIVNNPDNWDAEDVDDSNTGTSMNSPGGPLVALPDLTSFTLDTTPPTVASIQLSSPGTTPTNADVLAWDITFADNSSTSLNMVDATDFTVTGTGLAGATVTNVTNTGLIYTVTVSGGNLANSTGTVTIGISGSNDITDVAGNTLDLGPTPSPNVTDYVLDNDPPAFPLVSASVSASTAVGFTIDVDQGVSGTVYYLITSGGALRAPTSAEVMAGTYSPTTGTVEGSGSANTMSAGSPNTAVSEVINTLSAATMYDVYVVGADDLGNLQSSVTKVVAMTRGFDMTSTVTALNTGSTPVVDYLTKQSATISSPADADSFMDIQITDVGTDGVATILETLDMSIVGATNLKTLALYAGTQKLGEVAVSGSTVSFTGLNYSVGNGASGTIKLYGTFQSTVTDNDQLQFTITGASAATTGGSQISLASGVSLAGANMIAVMATEYAFDQQPTDVTIDVAMSPAVAVEAVDMFGNRDVDYSEPGAGVTITSSGTLSGTVLVPISSGMGTAGPIIHTVAQGGVTLTVTGALPMVVSSSFMVRSLDTNSVVEVVTGIQNGATEDIDYANHQQGLTINMPPSTAGVSLMNIAVRDIGGNGGDGIPTHLTDLEVTITSGNETSIRTLALFDAMGNFLVSVQPSGTTANFTGIPFGVVDGTTDTIEMRGTFTTTVTDNARVIFEITGATAQATGSSTFRNIGGSFSSSSGVDNQIEVTADHLVFSTSPPSGRFVNQVFPAVVQAVDVNNNRDLDNVSTITLSRDSGPSPTSPPSPLGGTVISQTLTMGEIAYTDLTFAQTGTYTLRASDDAIMLTDVVSSSFTIRLPDRTSEFLSSTTLDERTVSLLASAVTPRVAVAVFDFSLVDRGGDLVNTLVQGVTIRTGMGTSSELQDLTTWIEGARLSDGTNFVDATQVLSNALEFTSIPILSNGMGELMEGGPAKTYTLSVWVKSTLPAPLPLVFGNKSVEFLLDFADIDANTAGSQFDPGSSNSPVFAVSSGAVGTLVLASGFEFTMLPSSLYVDFDFSLTVSAVDAGGNRDLDAVNLVTLSKAMGTGVVSSASGNLTENLVSGSFTWTDLRVNAFDNNLGYTFTVTDGGGRLLAHTSSPPIATSSPDNNSTLTRVGGEQGAKIPYISFDAAVGSLSTIKGEEMLTFSISDAGGDGLPTTVTAVDVDVTSGTASEIRSLGIVDGATLLGDLSPTTSNTIMLSPPITVPDGGSTTFSVYASFNSSVTDNNQFGFTVNAVTQPAAASSTIPNPSAVSQTGVNQNTISVVATKINVISINPGNVAVIVNENFSAEVRAEDSNGNVDVDFAETVLATATISSGTIDMTGMDDRTTPAVGTGVYTFSRLRLTDGGIYTLAFTTANGLLSSSGGGAILALYRTSDIILDPTFASPTFFDYTQYDESSNAGTITSLSPESLEIARYLVRDGGAGKNADQAETQITDIQFMLDPSALNSITNLALFTGSGVQLDVQKQAANLVTFSFNDLIPDTKNQTYVLKATFDQASHITDQDQLQITVAQVTEAGGGTTNSALATNRPSLATPTANNELTIDVVADRLVYVNAPSGPGLLPLERGVTPIPLTIEARDANGNVDADEMSAIAITGVGRLPASVPARIQGATSISLTAGIVNTSITILSEHEDLVLTIADGDGPTGSRGAQTTISNSFVTTTPIDVYDTTAPTVVSSPDRVPMDSAVNVTLTTAFLELTFSEEIAVGTMGNIVIQGNTVPVAEQIILDITNPAEVEIMPNQKSVRLHLPRALTSSISYRVVIPTNTFLDTPNNIMGIGGSGVNDFLGYLIVGDWDWTMETVLVLQSATQGPSPNAITMTFSENVQLNDGPMMHTVRDYFVFKDRGGSGTAQDLDTLADATSGDNELVMILDSLSVALGDIGITYTDATGTLGGTDGVSESGMPANELRNVVTAVIVNLDNTLPMLDTVVEVSLTALTLDFSEKVQIGVEVATDFVVTDGQGTVFTVTDWEDNVATDEKIDLVVSSLASAVGDVTVTYTQTTSSVTDFAFNNLFSGESVMLERDATPPSYTSAVVVNANEIDLVFDEDVQTSGLNPGNFTVTDDAGNGYTIFIQSDGVSNDETIRILTADLTNALGDLSVVYNNVDSDIRDFGGNVANGGTQKIDRDASPPSMISAVQNNNTQLTVTFDEPVQLLGASTPTNFSVADVAGTSFAVSSQADGTPKDKNIELTVADMSSSVGDLFVTYTVATGSNSVEDFGGNSASSGAFSIDRPLTLSPVLAENPLPQSTSPIYATNDTLGDDLALFRTAHATVDPRSSTPVTITPHIDGSTITIYDDPALGVSDLIVQQRNVSGVTGVDPTVARFMLGSAIDFAGSNDNGVFTFYITETAVNGVASEGPAVPYSLAFQDTIFNSAESVIFPEEDTYGTVITVEHPLGQGLFFTGLGMTNFIPHVSGTSSSRVQFVPSVVGVNSSLQSSIRWQNLSSLVSATFMPEELVFTVNVKIDVLEPHQKTIFGQEEAQSIISLDRKIQSGFDIGDVSSDDTGTPDFYTVDAYYLDNGAVDQTVALGSAGSYLGGLTDGNIGPFNVVIYDGPNSHKGPGTPMMADGKDLPDITNDGTPTYVAGKPVSAGVAGSGEWEFNPAAVAPFSSKEVDTVRLVAIAQDDAGLGGGRNSTIAEVDVILYPNPTVSLTNIPAAICAEEPEFTIRANVFTYTTTPFSPGGIDETNDITNGYKLFFSPDGVGPYQLLVDYTITGSSGIAVNTLKVTSLGALSNSLKMPGKVAGFYRIDYTSLPQTVVNAVGDASKIFQILETPPPPKLDLTSLDLTGGFDPNSAGDGFYTFEFCSGDSVPDISVDIATSPADPAGSGPFNGIANTAYTFYNAIDGTVINAAGGRPSISSMALFGTSTPSGNIERKLYVTRVWNGCESGLVNVTIRIFADQDSPAISLVDANTPAQIPAQSIRRNGDEYFFEYCDVASATISYDQLIITSTLEDPDNRDFIEERSYFRIYDDEAGTSVLSDLDYDVSDSYKIDLSTMSGVSSISSPSANGIVTREFWIEKVVADSTVSNSSADFDGCRSTLTKVTVSIYTNPDEPAFNSYFGTPQNLGGVVNYYMCQNETFPTVGFSPPASTANSRVEWYTDAGLSDKINTAFSSGQTLGQLDLTGHRDPIDPNFDPNVPGTYTYYTRLASNINPSSSFPGCNGPVRQVDITVFPSVVKAVISANGVDGQLHSSQGTVGGFDHVFSFCVDGDIGLNFVTEFNSAVSYRGTTPSFHREAVRWYPADANGVTITGVQVAETDAGENHTVTARDLKIAGLQNDELNFAVLYNTELIDGFSGFQGCFSVDTAFVKIVISTVPATSFSFDQITIPDTNPGSPPRPTIFRFYDTNNSTITTNGVRFRILDENGAVEHTHVASNLSLTSYGFANPGLYQGELSIETAAGCIEVETRKFRILDRIVVNGLLTENFDNADAGGWFEEFQSDDGLKGSIDAPARTSSWEHGLPDGTNIDNTFNSIGLAWSTTGSTTDMNGDPKVNTYVGGENSYVYSPAYDISALVNPAIQFRTYRDLDGNKDGVVLQLSTDDGGSWTPLGNYNTNNEVPSTGQSWYNFNGISSDPGGLAIGGGSGFNTRRVGWADRYSTEELSTLTGTNGWAASTHALGLVKGQSNVRFRFALSASGADTDAKLGNGFGFDQMVIFQLEKIVVVEQFSSSVSVTSKAIDATFQNPITGIDPDRVMWINYFTDLANNGEDGSTDPVNARNTVGPGARAAYYGIEGQPVSVLDGDVVDPVKNRAGERVSIRSWNQNDINIKELEPAPFDFPILRNTSTDPGRIAVTASFVAKSTIRNADLSFQFAVVEKEIVIGAIDANGNAIPSIGKYANGDVLRHVLRVMLPGPAGFNYFGDVFPEVAGNTATKVFTYSVDWVIDNVYDASKLRVIAFVQDNTTKQVLQSGFIDIAGATETITGIDDVPSISIYPNPADEKFIVYLNDAIIHDGEWILYDQSGKKVRGELVVGGTQQLVLSSKKLPPGMYFFHLITESNKLYARRVLIKH